MAVRTKSTRPQSTSPAPVDPVTHYATEVVARRIVAGPLVRLACQRHLDDLKNGPKRGLKWDPERSQWAINFFPEVLRLAEGEHAGQPFFLQPWQQFNVGSLFGWLGPDGYRRFRTAYLEIGKGNGKSPMAAGIGLYMTCADGEAGAHCYAAATTREQADILFQDAVKMTDAAPALSEAISKSGKRKVFNLAHLVSGSFFRPVSAEHKGLDGKRVQFAALDEVHEHPTSMVVDKMRAGTKGRRQALIFEITNSGFDRNSVCWHHREYSEKVLQGTVENDSWFAFVCGLDEGDDWKDEKVWLKANPNLGISITHKYLREQVNEAVGMPSKENIVKRLNFCIWTEQNERWMPVETWDECATPIALEELKNQRFFGAFDLASTQDIAAYAMLFPPSAACPMWRNLWKFYAPEAIVRQRKKEGRVPYDVWVRDGWITVTPGNVTDYDFIESDILKTAEQYSLVEVAYDRWNATQLVTHLQDKLNNGATERVVPFGQGFASMSAPMKELEKLILAKVYTHGGNPVAKWMVSNVAPKEDPAGNIKPDKSRSADKIDGIVATIMALGRAMVAPSTGPSIYETRGLVTL
jgi:phage terminase large subunit-like protein